MPKNEPKSQSFADAIQDDAKDTIEVVKKYRPDSNSIILQDGSELGWKVKPGKDKTQFGFTLSKDYTDDDVQIIIKIGGEVNHFDSPKGTKDIIQNAEFSATKKF